MKIDKKMLKELIDQKDELIKEYFKKKGDKR